jgi:hypothetical protein
MSFFVQIYLRIVRMSPKNNLHRESQRDTREAPSTAKILPALSLSKGACRREPACIELACPELVEGVESAEGIIL